MLTSFMRSKSRQERLWDACSYGREQTVSTLIADGANPNWRSHIYECFPIHVASQGKSSVVKMLLDAGCQVDALDAHGNTAIHHAAMSGHTDNVLLLLDAGASVDPCNEHGWTPLHNAAYWNHAGVSRLLISRGASPFAVNKDGRTPLHELCRSKSRDSIGLVDNLNGILDAMALVKNGNPGTTSNGSPSAECLSVSRALNTPCECKSDWDFEANFTPLIFACYHGHLALVEALLEHGADISATAQNGWTPLHWAAQRCHADVVELLLDHGASRSIEDLRGDLPCDVTNDAGLRDCLLPDPVYPNIVSNGYATTDEEDNDDSVRSPPPPSV